MMSGHIYEYEGIRYRTVERNAKVGEKVLAVKYDEDSTGIKPGDVLEANTASFGDGSIDVLRGSGFFDVSIGDKYLVLEPVADTPQHVEFTTDDVKYAPEKILDLLANLARRVTSLESQLASTQENVVRQAEELENMKLVANKALSATGNHGGWLIRNAERLDQAEADVQMALDDIVTLDERTQPLTRAAWTVFYGGGTQCDK